MKGSRNSACGALACRHHQPAPPQPHVNVKRRVSRRRTDCGRIVPQISHSWVIRRAARTRCSGKPAPDHQAAEKLLGGPSEEKHPQGLKSLREKPICRLCFVARFCRPSGACESLLGYSPGFRPPSAVADDGVCILGYSHTIPPGCFAASRIRSLPVSRGKARSPRAVLSALRPDSSRALVTKPHAESFPQPVKPTSSFTGLFGPTQVVPLLQSPTRRVFAAVKSFPVSAG